MNKLTALSRGGYLMPKNERNLIMRELITIQKREKLNRVYAVDEPGRSESPV